MLRPRRLFSDRVPVSIQTINANVKSAKYAIVCFVIELLICICKDMRFAVKLWRDQWRCIIIIFLMSR